MPAGIYLINTPTATSTWGGKSSASLLAVPNAQVVIKGDGAIETRIITTRPATVFEGSGATNAQLTLLNFAVECRSGYTSSCNSFGIVFSGRTLQAQGVLFRNFTQAIRVPENLTPPVASMCINECQFLYDHGRAGVAQADTTNQYPITSILGAGEPPLFCVPPLMVSLIQLSKAPQQRRLSKGKCQVPSTHQLTE